MKKLYLSGWEYNSYLIINELAQKVLENGGFIVSDWEFKKEKFEIVNRSILKVVEENERILNGKTKEEIEKSDYATKLKKQLDELSKISNKPRQVYFRNYLSFVLDGFHYYLQLDQNPFFDDLFLKESCNTNNDCFITHFQHYLGKLEKDYFISDSFYKTLSKKQIEKSVTLLFNQLLNSKESKKVQEVERKKIYKKVELL
jgi:hypothetical protein